MAEASSRRRVSYAQLDRLWEFLNDHRDIGTGYNKTSRARDYSKRMWQTIAETLNAHGDGAVKDWKAWSKYWNDCKSKLKRTVAAIRSSLQRTGGGPSDAPSLSEIEQKFLHLLGGSFGSGLPGIRVEPFNQETEEREIVNLIVNTDETQLNLFGDSISILGLAQNDLPQPGPLRLSITPPPILRTRTSGEGPQPTPRRSPRTRDPRQDLDPKLASMRGDLHIRVTYL